jgi:tRNA dimethylallyltransferase
VGPTASGKTAAAIQLAKSFHGSIISADSRQCYRELNIGVARPSPQELQDVPHYFIATHPIADEVTAATFEALAMKWTTELFAGGQDKIVMTGGTGLYIKAFCEGLDAMPPVDGDIRQQVRQQYEKEGLDWLQREVAEKDPGFYAAGENQNPQRLMRALEVRLSTGRSILDFRKKGKKQRSFQMVKIGLQLPKEELHRRIDERVDRMMENGLLNEVKGLLAYRELNALHTVGYTELFDHLDGRLSLVQAVEAIKKNTRSYAKRQMTWFRKDSSIRWVDATGGVDGAEWIAALSKITKS